MTSDLWPAIFLMALLPAICEELAFRGFILSGLRHLGHKWWAIAASSLMFGVTHSVLQQSFNACVVGALIGYIAVQSGSILPGMVFHFTHNSVGLVMAQFHTKDNVQPFIRTVSDGQDFLYVWWIVALGLIIAALLIMKFAGLGYRKTEEERLQDSIDRQAVGANV
jgi:sodium transport system permease protein